MWSATADPHAVIEGMTIAAYAVGANRGYIYIRAEYPLAIKRLQIALAAARDVGLLGENILETGFSFDIEVRMGAGAFVCGEETALIASIEGERGTPRVRPPYPAVRGLFGMPTLINNVETWGNIRHIILNGADWFRSIGTEGSPGTKVFALSGKVKNTGLVEIPMGMTLRELIFDIGGGVPNGKKFKAVQTGGDNCMVNIAKFFLEFTSDESCGQCVPCRVGLRRMLDILKRITSGNGRMADLDLLKHLGEMIIETSFCGLGKTAPNPVLSTLKYFHEEYREHIEEKKCRAKVCTDLITYHIDQDTCRACGICAKNCPAEAITGEIGKPPYVINEEACVRCGTCLEVCPFGAVRVLSGELCNKDRTEGSK